MLLTTRKVTHSSGHQTKLGCFSVGYAWLFILCFDLGVALPGHGLRSSTAIKAERDRV